VESQLEIACVLEELMYILDNMEPIEFCYVCSHVNRRHYSVGLHLINLTEDLFEFSLSTL